MMYIKKLAREIRTWKEVRKTAKENIAKLNEIGFDVDWVGRIYTIMEIPTDIDKLPQTNINETIERNVAVDLYIKERLVPLSNLLNELRLSDLVMYPEFYEQFENTNSVLVVLSPERRYFTFPKLFARLLALAAVATGVAALCVLIF